MPVWYIHNIPVQVSMKTLVPVYTGIYLNVPNRLVLSRWWEFQMSDWEFKLIWNPDILDVLAILVCTEYILGTYYAIGFTGYVLGHSYQCQ